MRYVLHGRMLKEIYRIHKIVVKCQIMLDSEYLCSYGVEDQLFEPNKENSFRVGYERRRSISWKAIGLQIHSPRM